MPLKAAARLGAALTFRAPGRWFFGLFHNKKARREAGISNELRLKTPPAFAPATTPVVGRRRGQQGRRLGVGPRGQISGQGCGGAKSCERQGEQKFFHFK